MKSGISPVVATVLLIAIAVIASVTTWFWVSSYTVKPALGTTTLSGYVVTGVYKNSSKDGCTGVDVKNTGGQAISNAAFYLRDYLTGKAVGSNGTDSAYPVYINLTSINPGESAFFSLSKLGGVTDAWISNTSLVTGLVDVGYHSAPSIAFNVTGNSKWILIAGEEDGVFNGYYWNGTAWVSNTSLVTDLGDIGTNSDSSIAFNATGDSRWTLIAGEWDGVFNGYYWNGTAWVSNTSLVTGLGDVGEQSAPSMAFNVTGNSKWILIAGGLDGVFYGFYWNGTAWVSNTSLVTGLADVGQYSAPSIAFNVIGYNKWILIAGEIDGVFNGYYWNGTAWVSNTSLVTGLVYVGQYSAPSIAFNVTGNSKWILIAGENYGNFYGYYWNATETTSATATVPFGTYILRTSSPGFSDIRFTCA